MSATIYHNPDCGTSRNTLGLIRNAGIPISIIAPCHRVVGAFGALTGFAGGLDAECYLLDFEAPGRRDGHSPNAVPSGIVADLR
jgi:hypothetical protein